MESFAGRDDRIDPVAWVGHQMQTGIFLIFMVHLILIKPDRLDCGQYD
jgi:hypothetical protein